MMREHRLFVFLLLIIFLSPLAADEARPLTARAVADAAAAKPNVDASIAYIAENLPKVSDPKEKRALYAFFGSLQEQLARYDDARATNAEAARPRCRALCAQLRRLYDGGALSQFGGA